MNRSTQLEMAAAIVGDRIDPDTIPEAIELWAACITHALSRLPRVRPMLTQGERDLLRAHSIVCPPDVRELLLRLLDG